jgi:spermidine/putrescine transport system permease protein
LRGGRGLTAYAVLYLAFLYLPVLLLPIFSFNDSVVPAFPLSGVTTRWYDGLFAVDAIRGSMQNSLRVGIAAANISTVFGVLVARATTRHEFRLRATTLGFIMLPMVLPDIIVAVSRLVVLLWTGSQLSLLTITLGHVLICTPFAIVVLRGSFQGLDRSLEEASLDLGESVPMTFWRVTLPLVTPGLIASLLLTFTISFDEFILAFFLGGDATTLPIYIWGQLRFTARLPIVLALGSIILVFSIASLCLAEWLRRRVERRLNLPEGPAL